MDSWFHRMKLENTLRAILQMAIFRNSRDIWVEFYSSPKLNLEILIFIFYFQTRQRLAIWSIILYMTSLCLRLGNGSKLLLMYEHNFGLADHFGGLVQERHNSSALTLTHRFIVGGHYWQDVLFLPLIKYVMNWFGHGSVKIVKQNIHKSI